MNSVPRSGQCATWTWPAVPWGSGAPSRAPFSAPSGAPTRWPLPARAAPPSVRARCCNFPPTECRGRGRVRVSTARRCRGSSGRGSPRSRCQEISPGTAPAIPRFRHRGGWWARRAAACRVSTAAAGTAQRDASRRRRAGRSSRPTAAGAPRRRDLQLVVGLAAAGGDDRLVLALLRSELVEIRVFLRIGGVDSLELLLRLEHLAHALLHRLA